MSFIKSRILFSQGSDGQKNSMAKFVLVWNQVINSFRTEDLISNK